MNARIDAAAEAIGQYRPRSAFLTNEDAARQVLAAADEAEAPLVGRLAQALQALLEAWDDPQVKVRVADAAEANARVVLAAFDTRRADQ